MPSAVACSCTYGLPFHDHIEAEKRAQKTLAAGSAVPIGTASASQICPVPIRTGRYQPVPAGTGAKRCCTQDLTCARSPMIVQDAILHDHI
jgi:hypothetical protein